METITSEGRQSVTNAKRKIVGGWRLEVEGKKGNSLSVKAKGKKDGCLPPT
jgi:hypothetical protein